MSRPIESLTSRRTTAATDVPHDAKALDVSSPSRVAGALATAVRGRRLGRALVIAAVATLLGVGGSTWLSPRAATASPRDVSGAARARPTTPAPGPADTPDDEPDDERRRGGKKAVTGKLNLNTATVDELMLLPGVGLSKAERVLAWRGKHGPFRRVADLRRVKGFGYKSLKKLEAHLDVKGATTLRPSS